MGPVTANEDIAGCTGLEETATSNGSSVTVTKATSFPGYQQGWGDVRNLQRGQEEDQ